jgi:hypothetical protein
MLTLKMSVAATIFLSAIASAAGITYVVTTTAVRVSCPSPIPPPAAAENRSIPLGNPLPLNQGKKW